MYRNQYDHDVSIWSPQGRIFQIEYAMEAVKQGSATVGLKSKDYAVLVALKRSSSELSSFQKKIIPIDDHVCVSIAGLTSDGRLLSNFMRERCLDSRYVYDAALPVSRLVDETAGKMQKPTKGYGRRPYGVGLLVAGFDEAGPRIYQLCPSANYFDCKAMSIGARSQSARTYLERNLDKFHDSSFQEIVGHGLRALRECLPKEQALKAENCTVAVIGHDRVATVYENNDVAPFVSFHYVLSYYNQRKASFDLKFFFDCLPQLALIEERSEATAGEEEVMEDAPVIVEPEQPEEPVVEDDEPKMET